MNQIATKPERDATAIARTELIRVLGESLYPGAKPENIALVLSYCEAAGLDPMLKPVHIVPMWDSNARRMRDVIMPGIGHYRVQASRTGQYVGKSEPEFGPEVVKAFTNKTVAFPEWCKITVRRVVAGVIAEFTATERWLENYAVAGRDTLDPNAMWTKRAYGQIAKVAEAQALRMAFPELVGAETAEEMEGKAIDAEPRVINPEPEDKGKGKPRAKDQLDSFANVKPKADAKPKDEPKPDQGKPVEGEIMDDLPAMPKPAADDWAKGKWGKAWKWFEAAIDGVPQSKRGEFWAAHADMLAKVRAYNDDAEAAIKALASKHGVKINGDQTSAGK